jgi:hypothetical protein
MFREMNQAAALPQVWQNHSAICARPPLRLHGLTSESATKGVVLIREFARKTCNHERLHDPTHGRGAVTSRLGFPAKAPRRQGFPRLCVFAPGREMNLYEAGSAVGSGIVAFLVEGNLLPRQVRQDLVLTRVRLQIIAVLVRTGNPGIAFREALWRSQA